MRSMCGRMTGEWVRKQALIAAMIVATDMAVEQPGSTSHIHVSDGRGM